jgi:hypothetical protein
MNAMDMRTMLSQSAAEIVRRLETSWRRGYCGGVLRWEYPVAVTRPVS